MKILHLIEGGSRWLTGPNVAPQEAERRFSVCRGCEALTWAGVPLMPVVGGFCGRPLVDGPNGCGCAVGWKWRVDLTAEGKPIGKTFKEGERCPRSKW